MIVNIPNTKLFFIVGFLVLFILGGGFIPLEDDLSKNIIKFSTGFFILSFIFLNIKKYNIKVPLIYFCCCSVLLIFSMFQSLDLSYALLKYDGVVFCVILSCISIFILYKKFGWNTLANTYVYFMFFLLILTILYKLIFGFWDRDVRYFINGANVFGWVMGFSTLVCLSYNNKKKIINFLCILFFLGVIWSGSKGSLLATILCSGMILLFNSKLTYKLGFGSLALLILLFIDNLVNLIADFFPNSRFLAIIRIIQGDTAESDHGSIGTRQEMFDESLQLFLDNLVTGIGLANYPFYSIFEFDYPHNAHLEVFMEGGVITGICYLIYVLLGFLFANINMKIFIIFFIIVSSFSGDISYLKFLLIIVTLSFMLNLINKKKVLK